MTLLYMDGFEDDLGQYTLAGSVGLVTGRGGGATKAANPTGFGRFITPNITTASTTLCAAFAINFTNATTTQFVFFLGDGQSTEHVYFEVNSSFQLTGCRGGSGTVIWGPTNTGITTGGWNHFEFLVTLSDTVGAIKVWLNGAQIGTSPTNLDTKNAGTGTVLTSLKLGGNGNAPANLSVDDLYVYDTLGSYNNAAPLGDSTVEHLRPEANGTVQWTPSAGSNWQCVDEVGAYTTADYVSSSTVGQRDIYEIPASVRSTGLVLGVMPFFVGDRDNTAARSAAPVVRDSTGTRTGTSLTLANGTQAAGYTCYDRRNDGAAITIAELAGMGVGVEVTA